jgi:hypothetical protein
MVEPEPIPDCDALRKPENAGKPDERSASFVVVNHDTGESRPRGLADEHAELVRLILDDGVPREVRVHFETAKNLLLYSWFCYRFAQVAELHALATVEMALRSTPGMPDERKRRGLGPMLQHALDKGWIQSGAFRNVKRLKTTQPPPLRQVWVDHEGVHVGDLIVPDLPDFGGYAAMLPRELPRHRNILAHGSEMLNPWSANLILELCCDIINQLFPVGE